MNVRSTPRRWVGRLAVVALVGATLATAGSAVAPPEASAAPTGFSRFTAVAPCRVADTRVVGPALSGTERTFAVTGTGLAAQGGRSGGCGIPAGATAAVLTVSAVDPAAAGFLRAWPADTAPPTATVLNFTAGRSITNTAEIPLSPAGQVKVRSFGAGTHVVVDVTGYFSAAGSGRFAAVSPCRVADTRVIGPALSGSERTFTVTGTGPASQGGDPAGCGIGTSGTAAVVLSVSAVDPSGTGFLRAWPADTAPPTATVLNVTAGRSITNTVTVPISPAGQVKVRNFGASTHLVIDVVGVYATSGSEFVPVRPCRVVDTRAAGGALTGTIRPAGVLGASSAAQGGSVSGCPVPFGANAAVLSVSAVDPAGGGFLRAWPATLSPPNATLLNYTAATSITNTAVVEVPSFGEVRFRNFSAGTHLVVDVLGFFTAGNPATTSRVSLTEGGGQGSGSSTDASMSADGRFVAFTSFATDLVAGDTNGLPDVFVRDRALGTTVRVSVTAGGAQGNASSFDPHLSADGRYVVFTSVASNLVPGDTNAQFDVFRKDLTDGSVTLVSVADGGGQGNGASNTATISADGRLVAFQSNATNLVGGDTNGATDVFVRNLAEGTTTLVSRTPGFAVGSADSVAPRISGDGRRVAFVSDATDLVAGDTNGVTDVFVRTLATGTTVRASVGTSGQGDAASGAFVDGVALSFDGSLVVFPSQATNLVPSDTNGVSDVFLRNVDAGVTTRVSISSFGAQANNESLYPQITSDGTRVVFESSATNLVPSDTNGSFDVFVHDVQASTTTRISVSHTGAQLGGTSYVGIADGFGYWTLFETPVGTAVPSDTNGVNDVFARGIL